MNNSILPLILVIVLLMTAVFIGVIYIFYRRLSNEEKFYEKMMNDYSTLEDREFDTAMEKVIDKDFHFKEPDNPAEIDLSDVKDETIN